ncbi:hypothetical protein [Pseudomonas sp. NW5]|uniref:DUF7673 family protein n=1 Tax=Pseudomonas sp. NW5 TaxID=2934934 RepID=UPI00202290D2|nr:hypothetical protein [Pseudomonas sp. NW5]MCL7463156.1 hypothetical protein [Pseudomonas sp. NW5]
MSNSNYDAPSSTPRVRDIGEARRARELREIEEQVNHRLRHYQQWQAERPQAVSRGIEALVRVLELALYGLDERVRGICRDFLLGLSTGRRFDLTRLRHLDLLEWQDCLDVLRLQQYSQRPLPDFFIEGYALWQRLDPRALDAQVNGRDTVR